MPPPALGSRRAGRLRDTVPGSYLIAITRKSSPGTPAQPSETCLTASTVLAQEPYSSQHAAELSVTESEPRSTACDFADAATGQIAYGTIWQWRTGGCAFCRTRARLRDLAVVVRRQISQPAMAALTWADLIEWQTIKVPAVVLVGPGPRSRGLRARRSGRIVAGLR